MNPENTVHDETIVYGVSLWTIVNFHSVTQNITVSSWTMVYGSLSNNSFSFTKLLWFRWWLDQVESLTWSQIIIK